MIQKILLGFIASASLLVLTGTAQADPFTLGPAADYSVLGISSVTINNSNYFAVRGNVGVGGGNGALQKATVNGNVIIAPAQTRASLVKISSLLEASPTGQISAQLLMPSMLPRTRQRLYSPLRPSSTSPVI